MERFANLKNKKSNPVMEKFFFGEKEAELKDIEISKLKENPYQPRLQIRQDEVEELAKSIQSQGLIQPIVVSKQDDSYIIVAGHRRVAAHKYLKKSTIKAYVIKADNLQLASMSVIENLQRENLNIIEIALALQRYKAEFEKSYEEIGKEIGKSKSWTIKMLNILKLPEKIISDIREKKSTRDVTALNLINSYIQKVSRLTGNKNFRNIGKSENEISSFLEKEAWELYQGFLQNDRHWLKREIKRKLENKKPQPAKIEFKVTKKNGITIKIRENLILDEVSKKQFEEELQKLIEKYKG